LGLVRNGLRAPLTPQSLAANLRFTAGMRFLQPLVSWSKGRNHKSTAASGTAQPTKESRFHDRSKIACPVTVTWQDREGHTHTIRARTLDMSGAGACIESSEPAALGACAVVDMPKLKLVGSAIVRHCSLHGRKYQIGLDFRNSLMKSL
jgi:hypothetical protein